MDGLAVMKWAFHSFLTGLGNFVYDPLADKNADRIFEPGSVVNYEIQVFLPGHVGAFFVVESFLFYEDRVVLATQDVPYSMISVH